MQGNRHNFLPKVVFSSKEIQKEILKPFRTALSLDLIPKHFHSKLQSFKIQKFLLFSHFSTFFHFFPNGTGNSSDKELVTVHNKHVVQFYSDK